MSINNILLPSKPKIIKEEGFIGIYEIDGLYPGYGHTLGNSLRRIILSSLSGTAITSIKIAGVSHEFSTIPGIKEDIVSIILNLKKVRIRSSTDEPQTATIKIKGQKKITAGDIEIPGQITILNPEQAIAEITDKNAAIDIELSIEKGLGYVPKEVIQKDRVEIGSITLDAIFSPIERVNYEVENMRVGNRTDFNKLKIFIETDGTITPHEALEKSVQIMISQLKAIVGFEEEIVKPEVSQEQVTDTVASETEKKPEIDPEFLKTRTDSIGLSPRVANSLNNANIRTIGGLIRKKEEDLLDIEGLGSKGVQEIKKTLSNYGINLK